MGTTTMPSSLRHPVCPNLPSSMLPTEEALDCFCNRTGSDDIRMNYGLLEATSIIFWIWFTELVVRRYKERPEPANSSSCSSGKSHVRHCPESVQGMRMRATALLFKIL